jgi:hypothetical protein
VREILPRTVYKSIATKPAKRAPMPETALTPELAWRGPVVEAGEDGLLVAEPGVLGAVVEATGAVGVGGLAGPTLVVTTGIVVVPGVVTG